jgi:hypothetical protein
MLQSRRHARPMQRILIALGLILLAVGLLWPWLSRLGLGRLPGDIRIERDGFGFYFPITTGLVISIVVSLILWLLRR